jgi:hypothetical protein
MVTTPHDSVIDAEAVRRALRNYPNIPRASTTNQPFSYLNGCYSLDDFLDQAMLDLYHLLREKTGSHSETARQLRINRSALYQRIERGRERLKRRPCNCPTPRIHRSSGMTKEWPLVQKRILNPARPRVRFRARPARAEVAWRSFAASSFAVAALSGGCYLTDVTRSVGVELLTVILLDADPSLRRTNPRTHA